MIVAKLASNCTFLKNDGDSAVKFRMDCKVATQADK